MFTSLRERLRGDRRRVKIQDDLTQLTELSPPPYHTTVDAEREQYFGRTRPVLNTSSNTGEGEEEHQPLTAGDPDDVPPFHRGVQSDYPDPLSTSSSQQVRKKQSKWNLQTTRKWQKILFCLMAFGFYAYLYDLFLFFLKKIENAYGNLASLSLFSQKSILNLIPRTRKHGLYQWFYLVFSPVCRLLLSSAGHTSQTDLVRNILIRVPAVIDNCF